MDYSIHDPGAARLARRRREPTRQPTGAAQVTTCCCACLPSQHTIALPPLPSPAAVFARLESKGLKQDTARTYIQAVGAIRLAPCLAPACQTAAFTHPCFAAACMLLHLVPSALPHPSVLFPALLCCCSKGVGHKFGKHLPRAVPLCIRYLRSAAEGDEELREHCLQVGCMVVEWSGVLSGSMPKICFGAGLGGAGPADEPAASCPSRKPTYPPPPTRPPACPLHPKCRRWRALCCAAPRMLAPSWQTSSPSASSSCGEAPQRSAALLARKGGLLARIDCSFAACSPAQHRVHRPLHRAFFVSFCLAPLPPLPTGLTPTTPTTTWRRMQRRRRKRWRQTRGERGRLMCWLLLRCAAPAAAHRGGVRRPAGVKGDLSRFWQLLLSSALQRQRGGGRGGGGVERRRGHFMEGPPRSCQGGGGSHFSLPRPAGRGGYRCSLGPSVSLNWRGVLAEGLDG